MSHLKKAICLIYPSPPPFGGMATQGDLLKKHLSLQGETIIQLATNQMPQFFQKTIGKIPGFRTCVRIIFFYLMLMSALKRSRTIHILACSHLYYYLHVLPVVFLGKLTRPRVMVNYRGGEAQVFFKGMAGRTLVMLRWADVITVPSGYLKEIFDRLQVTTKIVPNLIETRHFSFSPPQIKDEVRFVCTRNFEDYYDVATTVIAFANVKKDLENASLTLVGDGTQRENLQDLVNRLCLSHCIEFKGKVSQEQMPQCLASHDIFVNSSVVDNYPISILEAFACGLPVVSTAAGGIPYLIEDGKTGLLVPPGNAGELARKMILVATTPKLANQLALQGKVAAQSHTWEKIWPKLKAAYDA